MKTAHRFFVNLVQANRSCSRQPAR